MSDPENLPVHRFPVSVVMQLRHVGTGIWSTPHWEAVAVVVGDDAGESTQRRMLIRDAGGMQQVLWTGLAVALHKNDIESYRYNLEAANPSLFVICRADGEDLIPVTVTLNYDEAGRCTEAEDSAFALPMPPGMYQWLEKFVVENYVPEEPRKRKKENWTEATAFGRQPQTRDRR